MTLKIGCHLSSAGGYSAMGRQALEIGANTFQFFIRNPRGSASRAWDPQDADALLALMRDRDLAPLLAHAPYTMNPCSADPGLRQLAGRMMREDLERLEHFPGSLYNFHPGSHTGRGTETGIAQTADLLKEILKTPWKSTILLETMAGKGSEIGASFQELRQIIDLSENSITENVEENSGTGKRQKLGICLDTCHIYSAGYDIVQALDSVLEEFDRILGLERLKAVHLNDSMTPFASRKDRHERIGKGSIGLDAIVRIIRHPLLCHLPFYLETPNEIQGYAEEIKLLRELGTTPPEKNK